VSGACGVGASDSEGETVALSGSGTAAPAGASGGGATGGDVDGLEQPTENARATPAAESRKQEPIFRSKPRAMVGSYTILAPPLRWRGHPEKTCTPMKPPLLTAAFSRN